MLPVVPVGLIGFAAFTQHYPIAQGEVTQTPRALKLLSSGDLLTEPFVHFIVHLFVRDGVFGSQGDAL
jgi:hypothetical protein